MSQRRSSDLMKKMGSKNGAFDPEPPDQWLFNLNHSDGPERGLAWVKSKTIAFRYDSPFAIDQQTRRPLKVADMAADLGWALQTAKNVLAKLVEQGRVKIDKAGRIYLCADVPLAYERPSESALEEEEWRRLGEWEYFVQSTFPGYLADSVRGLPEHLREPFRTEYSAFAEVRPKVFAEAAAQARLITDRYEHTILSKFGIEKRQIEKRRDPEPQFLRLDLIDGANFVQGFQNGTNGHSVQSGNPTLYKPENGSVQSDSAAASLFTSDTDTDHIAPPPKKGGPIVDKPAKPAAAVPAHQDSKTTDDRWRDVREWFTQADPSAGPEQVDSLIGECVAVTSDRVEGGIRPPDLHNILRLWPLEGVRSAYALLKKKLPELLGDGARLQQWIEKRTSPNSEAERFAARRSAKFRELMRQEKGYAT